MHSIKHLNNQLELKMVFKSKTQNINGIFFIRHCYELDRMWGKTFFNSCLNSGRDRKITGWIFQFHQFIGANALVEQHFLFLALSKSNLSPFIKKTWQGEFWNRLEETQRNNNSEKYFLCVNHFRELEN